MLEGCSNPKLDERLQDTVEGQQLEPKGQTLGINNIIIIKPEYYKVTGMETRGKVQR